MAARVLKQSGGEGGPAAPAVLRWSAWTLACAAFAVTALVVQTLPREALDWQPLRMWAEPWRWWTAAFVHWSTWHLAANVLGCAVVAAFGHAARLPRRWTMAWLWSWPLVHLALAAEPGLTHYGGLSGLLHAGVAVAACGVLCRERGRVRLIGAAVLAGLTAKVVLEQPWRGPLQWWPDWDIPIAPAAHAAGLVAGLVCAAVAWATSPRTAATTMR